MRLPAWLSWAVPALVLVLALAGYFVFLPQTVADDARLQSLVVPSSGIAGLPAKPTSSTAEQAAYGLPALAAAAKSSPTRTGSWSIDWTNTTKASSTSEAYVVLDVLPSVAQATTLRGQLNGSYVGKATYANEKFTETASFALPAAQAAGLPSSAASYRRPKSKTVAAATLTTATLQVGRADVIIYVQLPGASRGPATALAARQLALLRRLEPGFSLVATQYPFLASLIWWLVAAALATLSWGGPKLVVATRRRRRAREEALLRAQVQMRGQKVLRRRGGAQRHTPGRRGARR